MKLLFWCLRHQQILVLKFQTNFALVELQKEISIGRAPGGKILHMVAKFVAGVLLLLPTFFTRIFGILLLLPISRHLIIYTTQAWLLKKLMDGSFKVFTPGGAGFGFGTNMGGFEPQQPQERDVTVIDVEPTLIEHSDKNNQN